jgi:hypothetical protein
VENSIASQSSQPGNYAAHGGGVYIASSPSVTLTHNLIRNNIAATVAGDYMGLGGGIEFDYSFCVHVLTKKNVCSIIGA